VGGGERRGRDGFWLGRGSAGRSARAASGQATAVARRRREGERRGEREIGSNFFLNNFGG
jgi:hypothetical protein